MNGRRRICLIDTNVLVYAVDPRDHLKQERAIDTLEAVHSAAAGMLSPQVLGEFFNAATRRLPSPLTTVDAERLINDFVRSWSIADLSGGVVVRAVAGLRRYQLSCWDAVIWATAVDSGAAVVLSEDFNDGAILDGVRFVNPFSATFDTASFVSSL